MTTTPFAQLTALAQAIAWRCWQTKNQFHPQVPSVSSIADATADAVATWAERFPRTCLSPRNLTGGRRKAVARLLRRAAFSSLEQTSRHGVTGTSSVSLAFAAALDTERSDHTGQAGPGRAFAPKSARPRCGCSANSRALRFNTNPQATPNAMSRRVVRGSSSFCSQNATGICQASQKK